jgi:molecular chaperone DnaK
MKQVNIGIDLGTTNSLIARHQHGKVTIIRNPIGFKETLPSVVGFRNDRVMIGDKAREFLQKDPVNVFGEFKRKMGTDARYYVVNLDENVTPVELSSHVLKELIRFLQQEGDECEAAVITVPASFDTMQSNATRNAGYMAGLKEVFLLQEPVAASLAYFNGNIEEKKEGYWLVYDLGGGTFDIALVHLASPENGGEMKVVDHEGNNYLGGKDFDNLIVEKIFLPYIIKETGVASLEEELFEPHGKYEKLLYLMIYKAEEAKKELSLREEAEIDFIATVEGKEYNFNFYIQRNQLNEIIADAVEGSLCLSMQVMERNNLLAEQVQQVIMIGGSTYIPYVRERVVETLGIPIQTNIDPTTAVAVGAAFYAAGKFYTPSAKDADPSQELLAQVDELIQAPQLNLNWSLSYNSSSTDMEEVLIAKVEGDTEFYNYRITRADGGYDTGFTKLKQRFTEFLPLMPQCSNHFICKVYDNHDIELTHMMKEIVIMQGQYSITGQPLPQDLCIEIDDVEYKTTKLEVIFERNSILPLKKTLYREISQTVKKGSDDEITIHILEGDRNARADSLLSVATIAVSGKNLTSDLLKGSDVEIQISVSESREISVNVYLVMTRQEFKNAFSVGEQQVNIDRLKDHYIELERDIRNRMREYEMQEKEIWVMQLQALQNDLAQYHDKLMKLKSNDASDTKFMVAAAIRRVSQEYDQIGGNERMEYLREEYLEEKEYTEQLLAGADTNKEMLQTRYNKICQTDSQMLRSRAASMIENRKKQLDKLRWEILWNTNSHLIHLVYIYKSLDPAFYMNYKAAQTVFEKAEKAVEAGRFLEVKQHLGTLYNLRVDKDGSMPESEFKGTGIG